MELLTRQAVRRCGQLSTSQALQFIRCFKSLPCGESSHPRQRFSLIREFGKIPPQGDGAGQRNWHESFRQAALPQLKIFQESSRLERDDFSSNRHPALSFCLSMISAQTLRVCREGKPVPTFPDHALAQIYLAASRGDGKNSSVLPTMR